jgi:hypothetical protein
VPRCRTHLVGIRHVWPGQCVWMSEVKGVHVVAEGVVLGISLYQDSRYPCAQVPDET